MSTSDGHANVLAVMMDMPPSLNFEIIQLRESSCVNSAYKTGHISGPQNLVVAMSLVINCPKTARPDPCNPSVGIKEQRRSLVNAMTCSPVSSHKGIRPLPKAGFLPKTSSLWTPHREADKGLPAKTHLFYPVDQPFYSTSHEVEQINQRNPRRAGPHCHEQETVGASRTAGPILWNKCPSL